MSAAPTTAGRRRKRTQGQPKKADDDDEDERVGDRTCTNGTDVCAFCGAQPAAVRVRRRPPLSQRKSRVVRDEDELLCLLDYYSTSAARVDVQDVDVLDQTVLEQQLPQVQDIFAEAFVQLQQELAEESARAYQEHSHDPLAILLDLNKPTTRRMVRPPKPAVKRVDDKKAGGFLQDVSIPERLVRTQQRQAQIQKELISRMNRAGAASSSSAASMLSSSSPAGGPGRRRSKRQLIWNVLMEEDSKTKEQQQQQQQQSQEQQLAQPPGVGSLSAQQASTTTITDDLVFDGDVVCRWCGSHRVESLSMNTNRSQDLAKGETWGMKDRSDEVITRYRCHDCGRIWHQEE